MKHKKRKISLGAIVFIVVLLIGGRVYLPYYVKDYVNTTLNEIDGYSGSVEDVDINLFRGAYSVQGLKLNKTNSDSSTPFIDIGNTDLSLQWSALFDGRIVSDIYLTNAKLNFVVNDDKAVQTGEDVDWTQPIKKLAPIDVNIIKINSGKIAYIDNSASPEINLFIEDLEAEVTNLRNVEDKNNPLPSDIKVSGTSIGGGSLNLEGKMNILKQTPDMDLDLELVNADITVLNKFANKSAGIDFEKGNLSVYTEFVVKDSAITGYVKPIASDVSLLDISEEGNVFEVLWETIAATLFSFFENPTKDQFATQIPINGDLEDIETGVFPAIGAILQNAFISAFKRDTDDSISFKSAEGGDDKEGADKAGLSSTTEKFLNQ